MNDLEQKFFNLISLWKKLERGAPIISWNSHSGFYVADNQGDIFASSNSIQSALDLALEFSEEDLERRKKELLFQAQALITKASSL